MTDTLSAHYIENALEEFRDMKALADKSVAQVSDEEFFRAIDPESNSIAVIMKHMSGNMRSRWTDFLNSDGEKPDRHRDTEFDADNRARAASGGLWEAGGHILSAALEPLKPEDLLPTATIRREPHTIVEA